MNTELKVENPNEIEFTLTMTMKLKDWLHLRDELGKAWPASTLSGEISDMVIKASSAFWPDHE